MVDRFWSKVDRGRPDACWNWTAQIDRDGYGRFRYGGKKRGAHQVSYMLCVGEIPEGLFVCHSCDNPRCVNPAHLWVGTALDNNRDKVRKGRGLDGEKNGRSVLSVRQIADVRRRYAAGGVLQRELAEELGITQVQVSRIVRHQQWLTP